MFKCEICGREIFKKIRLGGHTLCSKHMHQLHKFGKFLDTCPRSSKDFNSFVIKGDLVYFDIYNGSHSEKIGEFIIDKEDLAKVRYHKWRYSHKHIVTGLPAQGTQRELSWVILDLDNRDINNKDIVIDHIDGNPANNSKSNLRICHQAQNILNKSFMSNNTSGFIGVSYRSDRGKFDPEIRIEYKRCHLGYTETLEEAVYKRYVAEKLLFKEFANLEEQKKKEEFTKNLSEQKKEELQNITLQKLKAKGLWQ